MLSRQHKKNLKEKEEFRAYVKTLDNQPPLDEQTNLLDKLFENLSDREVQLLLRESDNDTMFMALAGAGGPVLYRVFTNMGDRGALLVKEEIEYIRETVDDLVERVLSAQHEIIEIYQAKVVPLDSI